MQNVHPYFVHFPIAILSLGLVWDLLGVVFKKESFLNAGLWAQLFGTVAMVAAVTTGYVAESTVIHDESARAVLEAHENTQIVAAGFFVFLFPLRSFLQSSKPMKKMLMVIYLVVAGGAVTTMLIGAHLGERLVYEYGVGGTVVTRSGLDRHEHQQNLENDEQRNR